MNPLVKCPRCEQHTYPQPTTEPRGNSIAIYNACEYCGWKIKVPV